MAADKYLVSETLKYSDGSETVVDFKKPENAAEIEAEAADMFKDNRSDSEVSASEPIELIDEETVSSTEDVPDEVDEEEIED